MADVDADVLTRTDHTTHCPFKGDATYWTVRVGDQVAEDVMWGYEDPDEGVAGIDGYVAFYLDRMGEVLEEDEPIIGHPRDPYHRVDTRPSSRRVVVRVDDRVVAETTRPMAVFETGLPPRFYIPEDDIHADLVDSDTTSVCPYKGVAAYRSMADGPADVAFSYPAPLPEGQGLEGHWSFWGDTVTTEVSPS